jgi:hypothetical protein
VKSYHQSVVPKMPMYHNNLWIDHSTYTTLQFITSHHITSHHINLKNEWSISFLKTFGFQLHSKEKWCGMRPVAVYTPATSARFAYQSIWTKWTCVWEKERNVIKLWIKWMNEEWRNENNNNKNKTENTLHLLMHLQFDNKFHQQEKPFVTKKKTNREDVPSMPKPNIKVTHSIFFWFILKKIKRRWNMKIKTNEQIKSTMTIPLANDWCMEWYIQDAI